MRFRVETNNPRPSRQDSQWFGIDDHLREADFKLADDSFHGLANSVGKFLLSQFISDILWVELP